MHVVLIKCQETIGLLRRAKKNMLIDYLKNTYLSKVGFDCEELWFIYEIVTMAFWLCNWLCYGRLDDHGHTWFITDTYPHTSPPKKHHSDMILHFLCILTIMRACLSPDSHETKDIVYVAHIICFKTLTFFLSIKVKFI